MTLETEPSALFASAQAVAAEGLYGPIGLRPHLRTVRANPLLFWLLARPPDITAHLPRAGDPNLGSWRKIRVANY